MPATLIGLATWAIACALLAALGTALARRYALRRHLLDQPGERRSHIVATPRGGGIAIVAVMLAALALAAVATPQQRTFCIAGAAGLAIVATVGWIDDHRPLSALLRLLAHAVAAALLALAVLAGGAGPAWALVAFALAIGLVNAWNFMDGINGLAASQAALVAAGFSLLSPDPAARALCVALVAACVGFLPFNTPSARIFLGDVGSGALGFLMAMLAVLVAMQLPRSGEGMAQSALRGLPLLLPLSAFLVDAGLTLGRRVLRGERWWHAHVQHAYQRWAATAGHGRVTTAYLGWTAISICVMAATWTLDSAGIIAAVSTWYFGGGIVWVWLQSRHRLVNEDARA